MDWCAIQRSTFRTDVEWSDFVTTYFPESTNILQSTNYRDAQLDLIYFDAGGGHRASAKALISAAEQQRRSWQINLINLRDLLEPADLIRRLTGVRIEDFYNSQLKSGLTIGTGPLLRITQGLRQADAAETRVETPMVTILTDLADYPPHFWIERQEQYLVCGTATAARQAIAMGHARERVFRTSGMIVRPEFYRSVELS